jgi:hypothetical protein
VLHDREHLKNFLKKYVVYIYHVRLIKGIMYVIRSSYIPCTKSPYDNEYQITCK